MFLAAAFLFIFLLLAVLVLFLKADGVSLGDRFRKVNVAEYHAGPERRRYPRYSKNLTITYAIGSLRSRGLAYGDDSAGESQARTKDISEGGVKLVLEEKLSPGTSVTLRIEVPGSKSSVASVTGLVIWTEDAEELKDASGKRFFYSGVRFSAVKEPSRISLIDYIRTLVPA